MPANTARTANRSQGDTSTMSPPKNLICMMDGFYASGQHLTLGTLIEDAAYRQPHVRLYPLKDVKPVMQTGMYSLHVKSAEVRRIPQNGVLRKTDC